MPTPPEQLEQALASKIAKSVQTSPEDALLGFLDVDEGAQQEVLQFLRNRPSFLSVSHCLSRYPALSCYGLAVAAPIGLQDDEVGGSAFYGGWQSAFGYSPPASEREVLAHKFVECLDRLGLPYGTIFPDQELHIRGGCYLFHGAILPHFVEPLRAALESAQRTRPLPDPDDADRAASFATYLAEKVHPAQQRLRKTLQSRVGSFLVRRLVRWLLTRDDSLFPPHIKPLLQEQKERGIFVRGPFVQFDETEGRLQLVLPAQTSSVADSATRWLVSGRQYRASSEQPPIPLEELGIEGTDFNVTLSHLQGGRENVVYHLQSGVPLDRGFRLFDAATGRERKASGSATPSIELAPGQIYLVLLNDAALVKSDHPEETAGDARYLRVQVSPGSDAVIIEHEGLEWTLRPRVRPGLYLSWSDDRLFRASRSVDGAEVLVDYGYGPDLTCVIPVDCQDQAVVRFSSRFDPQHDAEQNCPIGSLGDGVRLVRMDEALKGWIATLPPAVHAITISLECDGRRMTQEIIHWKGLQRISIYGDFYCDRLPLNMGPVTGFQTKEQALLRPRTRGGKAEMSFTKLGRLESEKWEVPANRVGMVIVSADGSPTEIAEGSEVEILPNDNRVIQFRTGGLLPVRLTCNGAPLGEISLERPVLSKFLSSIAGEYGRTGRLKAETVMDVPGEKSWSVLNWRTPQTAKECRLESSNDRNHVTWLIRKVSVSGVTALRIRLYDFSRMIAGEEAEGKIPLTIPIEAESNAEVLLGKGFSCSVRRKPENLVQVQLSFDRAEMRGAVWVTELECLLIDSTEWQPVMSREAHGRLAVTRLVFIGGTPESGEGMSPLADLFWGKPFEPLAANSPAWSLKGIHLARWLSGLQWLLSCKYPTPVWHQNGSRFKSLSQRLSAVCLMHGDQERTMWWTHAITELQNHACEAQPVIMPCLLISCSFKMSATTLKGTDFGVLTVAGIITKAFFEASLYEGRTENHVLEYVKQACAEKRIDVDLLCHFSRWHQLLANHPVKFGDFQYRDWSNKLAIKCKGRELCDDGGHWELLSPSHLIACLSKAKRRADVLLSVSEQDYGHWLSGPISFLWGSRDRVLTAIAGILGPRLLGAPAEVLLCPLTKSDLLAEDRHRKEFLGNIMMASCLLALAMRAKAAGIITTSQADSGLHSLIPSMPNNPDSDDKMSAQIQLILGTAPELFSFYYLLFTLSLPPVP